LYWDWNFGDGNTTPVINPTHTFAEAGVFYATLTVEDYYGFSQSKTITITATESPLVKIVLKSREEIIFSRDSRLGIILPIRRERRLIIRPKIERRTSRIKRRFP